MVNGWYSSFLKKISNLLGGKSNYQTLHLVFKYQRASFLNLNRNNEFNRLITRLTAYLQWNLYAVKLHVRNNRKQIILMIMDKKAQEKVQKKVEIESLLGNRFVVERVQQDEFYHVIFDEKGFVMTKEEAKKLKDFFTELKIDE